ncbi:MAG: uracil-DNA glycosylase [Bacteroidia bacterium]
MAIESHVRRIEACGQCPRLAEWRKAVSLNPPRRFRGQAYWAKPVAGFGDWAARVLVIGLAPAAHGANRTGRMFTGDNSGKWLYRALYETGFSNKPESLSAADGLELKGIFLSALLRCAPPQNKPLCSEIENCLPYLLWELENLVQVEGVILLGRLAWQTMRKAVPVWRHVPFQAGEVFPVTGPYGVRWVLPSYHPSQQNTFTGKLLWVDWLRVFQKARALLDEKSTS